MHKEYVDCIVIGAGVIGLAIARALALTGRHVFVLESEKCIGTGISSRNSEVIHAGIYYPSQSLKAKFCVSGRALLYDYAKVHNIPYKKCEKMIVATHSNQMQALHDIRKRAEENGVHDLSLLSKSAAKDLEPALNCLGALLSPSTGIIDTHNYMLSLHGDIENHGSEIVLLTSVSSMNVTNDEIEVYIEGEENSCLVAKTVINAAGLGAVPLAHKIKGFPKDKIPSLRYAKGNYFSLTGKAPFSRLIYPVPEDAGLGVHFTLDLMQRARFGPDVEWIEDINYNVSNERGAIFYSLIRRYWPDLPNNALVADYSGIRPKISIDGGRTLYPDFLIQDHKAHNIKGLINLFGIESPGLTASLAIANYVAECV